MKRCLLLLAALATIPSTYALPAGEFPIAPSSRGLAPFDRRNLKVAANADIALAVWEDFRVDPNQPPRIWATRVRHDNGVILDPTGFVITALPATPGSALQAVATDGQDFLVAWNEGSRLKLARVIGAAVGAGVVVPVPDPAINAGAAAMTFFGDTYAILSTAQGSPGFLPTSIELTLLFKNGGVARHVGTVVFAVQGIVSIATTTSSAGAFLDVAWSTEGDVNNIHAASFLTGNLQTFPVTPINTPLGGPPGAGPSLISLASDGTDLMAVWYDVTTGDPSYRMRRFDGNGVPIGPTVIVAAAPDDPPAVAIAWDGSEYEVLFRGTDKALRAVRYQSDGTRIDTFPLQLAPPLIGGVAAAGQPEFGEIFAAWLSVLPNGPQVTADFIFNGGGSLRYGPGSLTLSSSIVHRSDATVVWRGDHYLAAWQDASGSTSAVVGRFTADGVPLDGTGISLSGSSASVPVLASNGRTAIVAWHDFGGVSASFVDEAGHVARRMFDFPGGQPSVNWNGQQYVVMWRSSDGQLLGLRLTGAGVLIDAGPLTIAPVTGDPAVGWTGNSYVVAFPEVSPLAVFPPPVQLWAQLVSPSLTAIGSRIQIATSAVNETLGTPTVTDSPAGGSLIVWTRIAGGVTTIRAARAINGAIIDPVNGLLVGQGSNPTVYGNTAGWGVVNGPFLFVVTRNGVVGGPFFEFPFVPAGTRASVVLGGPAPLVVYSRPPVGTEQMIQVVARYLFKVQRERAVRH